MSIPGEDKGETVLHPRRGVIALDEDGSSRPGCGVPSRYLGCLFLGSRIYSIEQHVEQQELSRGFNYTGLYLPRDMLVGDSHRLGRARPHAERHGSTEKNDRTQRGEQGCCCPRGTDLVLRRTCEGHLCFSHLTQAMICLRLWPLILNSVETPLNWTAHRLPDDCEQFFKPG
jgi:hypothetical protein